MKNLILLIAIILVFVNCNNKKQINKNYEKSYNNRKS